MVGGPVKTIAINGRLFTSDSEDAVSITLPGYNNEVKPNGDGSDRIVKSRHTGVIEGVSLAIDQSRGDMEFLQETQDSLEFVPVTLTLVDGTVYSGNMQITDAVATDTKETTASITLNGKVEKL